MERRAFATGLLASALPAADPRIKVGLITNAEGPHLSAYLEGLAKTGEASAVVLADDSGQVEAAARKAMGPKLTAVYKTPKEMLQKENPALALVTLEAAISPPAILAALDAGCHVMAEKPSCIRQDQFESLASKADAQKRQLVLALANRIDPVIQETRRIIDTKQIGKIYGMDLVIVADQTRLTRPAYHKTWTASKARAGGGHLIWLGIHWLDLAMYVTGSRIREVAGFIANVGGQPIDTEDSAVLAMRFDNGTCGTLTSGYYLDKGYHSLLKVWGSEGWVSVQKHTSKPPMEWYSRGQLHPYIGTTEPAGYTPFVRAVVRAAAGADPWPLTTEDSLYVLKTVFAGYKAAESGQRRRISS